MQGQDINSWISYIADSKYLRFNVITGRMSSQETRMCLYIDLYQNYGTIIYYYIAVIPIIARPAAFIIRVCVVPDTL